MNNLQRLIKDSRFRTQRGLAEYLGVDQATVQRACTEHASAKLQTYKDCADALGVTLVDIFTDEAREAVEERLLQAYRALPEDRRRGWDDIVVGVLAQREQSAPPLGEAPPSSGSELPS